MKFNVKKMKELSRPMTQGESREIEERIENRDWLALSAKFALSLRHILRTEKMTQKDLAAHMGVSAVQVTKLLSGKENIGLQTIAKVEKAIGRSLVSFMDNTETSTVSLTQPWSVQADRSVVNFQSTAYSFISCSISALESEKGPFAPSLMEHMAAANEPASSYEGPQLRQ